MELTRAFFINISILITCAYLFNLVYKNLLVRFSFELKYGLTVLLFILAGYLMMFFSFEIRTGIPDAPTVRLDLRFLPVILGLVVLSRPGTFLAMGIGIGILRLTLGWDLVGFYGLITSVCIGLAAEGIAFRFRMQPQLSFWRKAVVSILIVNVLRVISVCVVNLLPLKKFLFEIFPVYFPVNMAVSFLFIYMIRDFQIEQQRVDTVTRANRLLRIRTEDLNQAKQELEAKAILLETASRYKSEFMANMSHELKTPLNSILLLSQLQSEEDTTVQDRIKYGQLIYQSGNELLSLVNDILDLTKVESGKLEILEDRVCLAEVCRSMEEMFRPLAESREIGYRVTVHGEEQVWIWTDPMRLNQILRNLLGNAFKFTEKGWVSLDLTVDPENREAVFRVADTGVGIDAEKKGLIFEAFRQEDGSINRKYGGSGLGLSISRQLAERLGGRIELTSEKGKGSCFTLRLPLREEPGMSEEGELDGLARRA